MYTIEKITQEDLPGLTLLYTQLAGVEQKLETLKENFKNIENNENYYLMGMKTEEGTLIGSAMGILCYEASFTGRFMILENMIIDAAYQGKGAGKKLLGHIEQTARQLGCDCIQFCSTASRKDAQKFYVAAGYDPELVKGYRKFL